MTISVPAGGPGGLERDSHVALYAQLAERLRAEIAAGRHPPGARLPSEQALRVRFGVSRVTVRLAVDHLVDEGIIVRKQGKGTFVTGAHVHHDLRDPKGFYHLLLAQGLEPETELLEFGPTRPPRDVCAALGARRARRMLLRRRYRLEGRPIALATTWLPAEAERVSRAQAESHPSYSILQELLGLRIARARIALRGRLAGRGYAGVLAMRPSAPMLIIERVSLDSDGYPLELTRFALDTETFELTLTVEGPMPISPAIKRATGARRRSPGRHARTPGTAPGGPGDAR